MATALGIELTALLVMLASNSPLRAHALVEVDAAAELGFLRPGELLHLGRGLHLVGHAADAALLSGQAPGVLYLAAPPPGTEWAKDIVQDRSPNLSGQVTQATELVRERLISPHPVLLWLSQCQPETILPLSQAARLRLQRPILVIDGAALAGWPTPQLFAALRRLRRDADLRGAVVVVSETQLLGGAWAALTAPRPPGQTAPVVLCSSAALPMPAWPQASGHAGAELVPQAATLRAAAASAAANPGGAATDPGAEDPATLASREEARRRAAMDAARAMGKPIPPELMAAAAASPAPVAPPPRPAAPAAPAAPPAQPTPPPRPAAAPAAAPTSPAAAPARPTNPRLAAALAKAGLPPAGSTHTAAAPAANVPAAAPAAPAVSAAPSAPQPSAEPPPAAPDTPGAAAPADAAPESPEPAADDPPPLPLADDATLDELLRVCRTTPNQLQRAELLRKLSGKKSPHVIQMFRANVQSAHPAVRAAAEEGMASLFGANWNRTRAIAPPVQPPRSDDGGRGPGGAF